MRSVLLQRKRLAPNIKQLSVYLNGNFACPFSLLFIGSKVSELLFSQRHTSRAEQSTTQTDRQTSIERAEVKKGGKNWILPPCLFLSRLSLFFALIQKHTNPDTQTLEAQSSERELSNERERETLKDRTSERKSNDQASTLTLTHKHRENSDNIAAFLFFSFSLTSSLASDALILYRANAAGCSTGQVREREKRGGEKQRASHNRTNERTQLFQRDSLLGSSLSLSLPLKQ